MGILGAALVFSACFAMGLRESLELRRSVSSLCQARQVAECLQTEICAWRLPLTQVLEDLQERFPSLFSEAAEINRRMGDEPFSLRWKRCLEVSGLCKPGAEVLHAALQAVAGGEVPERAMELCLQRLAGLEEAAETLQRERGRLYAALGAAGGGLLVIVLC